MTTPVVTHTVTDDSVTLSGPGLTTVCVITFAPGEQGVMWVEYDISGGATVSVAGNIGGSWVVPSGVATIDEPGNQGMRCFVCAAPDTSGAATTVTATFSTAADARGSQVHAVSGGNVAAAVAAANHQATPTTTADAVTSGNVTPPTAVALLLACTLCTHNTGGGTPAAGSSPFVSIATMWDFGTGPHGRSEYRDLSSTTPVAATFTATGNTNHITIALAIPEAADNPTVSSFTPADNATGVSVSTTLAVTLNQNVAAGAGNVKVYEYTAPTSAPTVQTRNTDAQQTNATSFVVDTPGTPIAGDLQIICVSKDDNEAPTGTFPPTGFLLGQSDASGTTNWAGWFYRFCDGSTDPATVTLTESSENWISRGWLIRGADPTFAPVGGTVATGTSTAANPPSVAYPGDAGDACVVLYYVGIDGNSTFSAHPGGYSNTGSDTTTDATTGNRCAQAYGELASSTSGSNDPGALTNTSNAWKAFTIAVRGKPTDALIETIAITDGSKVSIASATVTVDPTATLSASKLHYINIDSGAIVASDDSAPFLGISGRTTWNFTTGAGSAPVILRPRTRSIDLGAEVDDYALFNRRRRFIFLSAPTSSPPGIANEADAALTLVAAHVAAVGIASETDAAFAPVASSPGIGLEVDAALALTTVHAAAPGLSTEVDSALVLPAKHTAPPGIATETDDAFAIGSLPAFIGLFQPGEMPEPDPYEQNIVLNRRRRFVFFTSAASSAPPGLSNETDTTLGLASVHTAVVGLATETDSAQALSIQHVATPGLATESDASLALSAQHAAVPGLATETDTSIALAAAHVTAPGLANETDTSLALATTHVAAPGLSLETDTAISGAGVSPGISSESDTSLVLAAAHVAPPGLPAETDAALALVSGHRAIPGLSSETDIALARTAQHVSPPGLSTEADLSLALAGGVVSLETDTALALSTSHVALPGLSTEVDAALALTTVHAAAPGLSTEVDASLALATQHRAVHGLSSETDTSLAPTLPPGLSTETDTAIARTASHVAPPGLSTEVSTALALAVRPGLCTEVDTALTLGTQHRAVPGLSVESDAAFAQAAQHRAAPGVSAEVDAALSPGIVPVAPGLSVETSIAFALLAARVSPPGISTEMDVSLAMGLFTSIKPEPSNTVAFATITPSAAYVTATITRSN